jgi:hypothetical protein
MHRSKQHLLFDHFVGADEQRRGHVDAEQLGHLQVDDELELGGLLDRQVGRIVAALAGRGSRSRSDKPAKADGKSTCSSIRRSARRGHSVYTKEIRAR